LRLWDARSGAELLSHPVASGLLACAFSPRGDRVCGAGTGGTVYIIELTGAVEARRAASGGPEPTVSGLGERDGDVS
jgi:hypothetical protein